MELLKGFAQLARPILIDSESVTDKYKTYIDSQTALKQLLNAVWTAARHHYTSSQRADYTNP